MTEQTERLSLRLTPQQHPVLRRAAEARSESTNEFIVRHALEAAEMELADRRIFVLDDVGWDELQTLMSRPPKLSSGHARTALRTYGARITLPQDGGPKVTTGRHAVWGVGNTGRCSTSGRRRPAPEWCLHEQAFGAMRSEMGDLRPAKWDRSEGKSWHSEHLTSVNEC